MLLMKKHLLLFSFIACIFLYAQESVTKKYLAEDNITSAKNFSKEYIENVLSRKYTLRTIGDPESNNYDIEYTVEDKLGFAIILINYDFRANDFTLKLKSLNYESKINGKVMPVTSNSTDQWISEYYDNTKKLLLTLHSDYIAPDLNE